MDLRDWLSPRKYVLSVLKEVFVLETLNAEVIAPSAKKLLESR